MNLEHKVKMLDAEQCFYYVQNEELKEELPESFNASLRLSCTED